MVKTSLHRMVVQCLTFLALELHRSVTSTKVIMVQ